MHNRNVNLPLRALELLESSRHQWQGVSASRFPSRVPQFISTFSLMWIWCVHDLMMWRDEPGLLGRLLPGVRATIDRFGLHRNEEGLLQDVPGWPFIDWVHPRFQSGEVWRGGCPARGNFGISALVNLVYLLSLQKAVRLENYVGEPELAALFQRSAEATARAIRERFYSPDDSVLLDDASGNHLSTHAQIYGILSGVLSPKEGSEALDLAERSGWVPPGYMFRFYQFEALRLLGRAGEIVDRLQAWQEMLDKNSFTVWEHLEPTRSDCHGWSGHPLFHLPCSVAGIRPAAPGFREVLVAPQPGPLRRIRSTVAHPRGMVRMDLEFQDGGARGTIELPPGLAGEFSFLRHRAKLQGGRRELVCE